jgi:hypothetical protein
MLRKKGMSAAVIDIPNAFIQRCVEDEKDMAIIKIRGVLVDILVEITPDAYKSYATTDKKGVKQLLAQCQNALQHPWYDGCKPALLLQVHQESDGNRIFEKIVRSFSQTKLWSFTTWRPRLCMPPNVLGLIPAQLSHS